MPTQLALRAFLTGTLFCLPLAGQLSLPPIQPAPTHTATAPVEAPKDALGRSTPRGAMMGFLAATRNGNLTLAAQYLNTRKRGAEAERLAEQLSTVLNRRLPANLLQLSDAPEGSQTDLKPGQELAGTIAGAQGDVEIVLERVARNAAGLWLFSAQTLEKIPGLFEEISAVSVENVLPEFLVKTKIGRVALFEWLGLFVGLPAVYLLTALLNRLFGQLLGSLRRRRRKQPGLSNPEVVPMPVRLLLVAALISWAQSAVSLPLLARQFWGSIASALTIAAGVWLMLLANGRLESSLRNRLIRNGKVGATSVIRLGRRMFDVLLIFIGLLIALYHFGLNPTAALAGLGVGGIAIALAAQKTLENVVGGISIIFDQVVRVGDTLRVGETVGTVDDVGLRSTRLRTLDRTVVSVPNSQIANLSLENFSTRDKFWLHPILSLRYDTTAAQLRSILTGLNDLLAQNRRVEPQTFRVRLLRFGASSLDLDIFAYVRAEDWNQFLEIQGELLLRFMECVQAAGAQLAMQSAFYVEPRPAGGPERVPRPKA